MKFQPKEYDGKVAATLRSLHPDAGYGSSDYVVTRPVDHFVLDLKGVQGDRHYGFEATSGNRMKSLYERGTRVRNNRQWSAISLAEIKRVDDALGLEGKLTPGLMEVNLVIDGVDDLTQILPLPYLVIKPGPDAPLSQSVVLVGYAQMLPCTVAGKTIAEHFRRPEIKKAFPKAANEQRGLSGWVERGGIIRPGYHVQLLLPTGRD